MKRLTRFEVFFLIAVVAFFSCKKETTPQKIDQPPVASAGADLTIVLPTDSVELRGSGSDADGIIVSYEWTKLSGPAQYTLANSNAAVTKVKSLVEGVYVFELKVTDDGGFSAKDDVIVKVVDPNNNPNCYGCWDY